jgi:UDP:flavonoid glycosyltransferase YjiC (YdhE family)
VARGLQAELVRVAVATGDAVGATVPDTPNLELVRSLPLGPALERAAVLVTHGELSLVQRALAAGVPVVAVPAGGEEPEVAGRLERTGAGVVVPHGRLSPSRMRVAVTQAMARRDVAGRVGLELAATGGPAAFAAAAAELLEV